ncbi:MAG: DUF1367 family protein [Cyanobacteria bacterium SZAS TMP-1]|nr:DUF1367 family protein [Cyanobacteria bacterium SZAS TMP-1]
MTEPDDYLIRTMFGFKPAYEHTEQKMQGYGVGELIRVKFFKGRNIQFHRLYFGLLKLVFENQEKYLSLEALRFAVTVSAGYVEHIEIDGGRTILKPRSIAFSKMDEHEFKEYFGAALKAVPRLLPQFEGVDLEEWLRTGGSW